MANSQRGRNWYEAATERERRGETVYFCRRLGLREPYKDQLKQVRRYGVRVYTILNRDGEFELFRATSLDALPGALRQWILEEPAPSPKVSAATERFLASISLGKNK